MRKNRGKRQWAVKLGIVAVTVILCFFIFEGVLRLTNLNFYIPWQEEGEIHELDPVLGWKLKPNSFSTRTYYKGSGHTPGETIGFKINSKGLRDNEYSYNKPDNTTRILLMGDSITFGYEVEWEDSISEHMEKMLEDYQCQVLNFGVSGYGTIQEYLLLREEGVKYNPDVVLTLFFSYNDGRDNIGVTANESMPLIQGERIIDAQHSTNEGEEMSSYSPFESLGLYLMEHSYVFALLGHVYYGMVGRDLGVDYAKQVDNTIFALNKIDELCHQRNIEHKVVMVPDGTLVSEKFKVAKSVKEYNEQITTDIIVGLESSNIPYIDLAPLLMNEPNTQDLYYAMSGNPEHFTPEGNRIVAEILVEEIKKNYLEMD